jgi:heme O synthase-like polyprenyltransferase
VIDWKWEVNNQPRRWNAWLDAQQESRLGTALARLMLLPLALLFLFLPLGAPGTLAGMVCLVAGLVFLAMALRTVSVLRAETADQMPA